MNSSPVSSGPGVAIQNGGVQLVRLLLDSSVTTLGVDTHVMVRVVIFKFKLLYCSTINLYRVTVTWK